MYFVQLRRDGRVATVWSGDDALEAWSVYDDTLVSLYGDRADDGTATDPSHAHADAVYAALDNGALPPVVSYGFAALVTV